MTFVSISSPLNVSPSAGAERRAWWLTLAAAALVVVVGGYYAFRGASHTRRTLANDWGVYYLAGADMRARDDIYNMRNGPLLTFKNAPVVALAMAPMSLLPAPVGRALWVAADALLVVLILRMTVSLIYQGRPPRAAPDAAVGIGLAAAGLALNYLLNQFQSGQITVLFISLTVFSFYLASRGRMFWAGAALAAAVCLKIVPLCFLPYLLLRRGAARGLAGFAAAMTMLLLLPALWVGWNANIDLLTRWPAHLRETQSEFQSTRLQNLSIPALVLRFTSTTEYDTNVVALSDEAGGAVGLALMAAAGVAMYGFIFLTRGCGNNGERDTLHLSLLLLFMTLFNPLAWRYNFVALLVPYAFCISALWRHPKTARPVLIMIGVACALTWVPRIEGVRVLEWLQIAGLRTFAALLVGAACVYHGVLNGECRLFPIRRNSELLES